MEKIPRVSIIVPCYKTPKSDLIRLMRSLRNLDYPKEKIEILLIEIEHQKSARWRKLRKVVMGKNRGYGAAVNLGISKARSEYVLLLNPDTKVERKMIRELLRYIEGSSGIGVAGPLVFKMGSNRISHHDLPGIGFNRFLGRIKPVTASEISKIKVPRQVDWISGSCMLIRKETWERVGGFDENYFMYWEDADFGMRLNKRGFKAYLVPQARVWHKVDSGENIDKVYYVVRNKKFFINLYSTVLGKFLLHLENIIVIVVKGMKHLLKIDKGKENLAFLYAILDFYRKRRGKLNVQI